MTSNERRPAPEPPRTPEQRLAPSPLRDDVLRHVAGGLTVRKAGEGQLDYLTIAMKEPRISSF